MGAPNGDAGAAKTKRALGPDSTIETADSEIISPCTEAGSKDAEVVLTAGGLLRRSPRSHRTFQSQYTQTLFPSAGHAKSQKKRKQRHESRVDAKGGDGGRLAFSGILGKCHPRQPRNLYASLNYLRRCSALQLILRGDSGQPFRRPRIHVAGAPLSGFSAPCYSNHAQNYYQDNVRPSTPSSAMTCISGFPPKLSLFRMKSVHW